MLLNPKWKKLTLRYSDGGSTPPSATDTTPPAADTSTATPATPPASSAQSIDIDAIVAKATLAAEEAHAKKFGGIFTDMLKQSGLDSDTIKKMQTEWKSKQVTPEQTIKEHEETIAKLTADLDTANKAKADAETQANEKISAYEYDKALDSALKDVKFKSDFARNGVKDLIRDLKLPVENGAIKGIDETLKTIRESHANEFEPVTDKPPATATYTKAGQTPLTATEAESLQAQFDEAKKNNNGILMTRLSMLAAKKGIKLK